jgi:ABC-type sugar transport system permease subunit
MFKPKPLLRFLAIVVVISLALALRLRAVDKLPIDFDEDDYLAVAQRYATALRHGDWRFIADYAFNYEHPPLTKLVYGLAIMPFPDAPYVAELPSTAAPAKSLPQPQFEVARLTAATLGWLEVVALAIFNPLAALFLGIHTWQIKYTSQVMLEALPSLTSTLTVLFYIKGRAGALRGRWNGWLLLSAVGLGLTAASKYTYCLAGVAILVDWLWATYPTEAPRRSVVTWVRWLAPVAGWGLLSIPVFVAFDPRLWVDGFQRLKETVLYHGAYAQSAHVKDAGYPMWQPLVWLSSSVPWHPGVFPVMLDGLISLLAVAGLGRTWRKQRVLGLWLGIALGFLLWWNTKWPQYILILTAPLAVAAAEGTLGVVVEPVLGWLRRARVQRAGRAWRLADWLAPLRSRDLKGAMPWLWPGTLALLLLTGFPLLFQLAMVLTDFNGASIRDGINGGIWRAVWLGLTGQAKAVEFDPFSGGQYSAQTVHYAGPGLLLGIFNAAGDILVFDVIWVVLSVALQAVLGIGVALMLNRRGLAGAKIWRTIFILPWAIPEFIGALVWLRTFEPKIGWVGMLVSKDVPMPPTLGSNIAYALGVLLVAATWYGFPFIMLAASAGLKLVPREAYDAAALDGANGPATFRYITWPLLFPLVAPALIIRSIFAFNQFYLFYVMQTQSPLLTFANISYYFFTYSNAYAVSAAINVFTVLVLVGLLVWFNRWSQAAEGVTYA